MKKFKAFLKGDKAPKEKEERLDPRGAARRGSPYSYSPSQPDLFGVGTPFQKPHIASASTTNLIPPTNPVSSRLSAPASASSTALPAAKRTTSPIRWDYGNLPGSRTASFSYSSPASTSQSIEKRNVTTPGSYEVRPGGRIGRTSALESQPRMPSHQQKPAAGGRGATTTTAKKTTKKDGAEESDSDDSDMDDLMAMMIAASLVSRSGAGGEGSSSSNGRPGIEALLLGAMLAKARQKREAENKPQGEKGEEEKKKLGTMRRDEEAARREVERVDRSKAARQATHQRRSAPGVRDTTYRTGASEIETFVEWRARRAREAEAEERKMKEERENVEAFRIYREKDQRHELQIDKTLPLPVRMRLLRERRERREREERGENHTKSGNTQSLGKTSTSTSTEAEKTEEPRRHKPGPYFKVKPLQKATAPPTPATPTPDQPTREILEENLKPTTAKKEIPSVTPAPEPTPTPAKRKGPTFKVPPLSAAQRAALPRSSRKAFEKIGSTTSTSLADYHIVFDRVYTGREGKIPEEKILKVTRSRGGESCGKEGVWKGGVLGQWKTQEEIWLWREV